MCADAEQRLDIDCMINGGISFSEATAKHTTPARIIFLCVSLLSKAVSTENSLC